MSPDNIDYGVGNRAIGVKRLSSGGALFAPRYQARAMSPPPLSIWLTGQTFSKG